MTTPAASHISSTRIVETHTHYQLAEPVPYAPTNPGPVDHAITRIMVTCRTVNGTLEQPTITAALRSGRHVVAGFGQDPDTRDDTLLTTFADLIADARARTLHPAATTVDEYADQAIAALRPTAAHALRAYGVKAADAFSGLAAVRHIGTTRDETPRTLHYCQHRNRGHICQCPSTADHGARTCSGYDRA